MKAKRTYKYMNIITILLKCWKTYWMFCTQNVLNNSTIKQNDIYPVHKNAHALTLSSHYLHFPSTSLWSSLERSCKIKSPEKLINLRKQCLDKYMWIHNTNPSPMTIASDKICHNTDICLYCPSSPQSAWTTHIHIFIHKCTQMCMHAHTWNTLFGSKIYVL